MSDSKGSLTSSAHAIASGLLLDDISAKVLNAQTENFVQLVKIAELDPKKDFRFSNLSDVDFSGCNLAGFDFTGASLLGARFTGSRICGGVFRDVDDYSVLENADDWNLYKDSPEIADADDGILAEEALNGQYVAAKVRWFNYALGYGLLDSEEIQRGIYFRGTAYQGSWTSLTVGQAVTALVADVKHGFVMRGRKRKQAREVWDAIRFRQRQTG